MNSTAEIAISVNPIKSHELPKQLKHYKQLNYIKI